MDNNMSGYGVDGSGQPMMNQHPPIFSGYSQESMHTMGNIPADLAAHMFGDSHMLMDDSTDAKRRRIARACDMCRKKKIKCDGKLPACTNCITYKTDCAFTQVEKKRAPPKGTKYIEGLENRLARMEHLLRLAGVLEDDDNDIDLGALEKKLMQKSRQGSTITGSGSVPVSPAPGNVGMTPQSSMASPGGKDDKPSVAATDDDAGAEEEPETNGQEPLEKLSEMMCSLVTNQSGETRFLGSSSGFSIFSPKGVEWVNGKMGDNAFQSMITEVSVDDHKWTNWKPEVFGDVFQRRVFRPLPPKQEALSLLVDYFENFNCMFPLFHQPTFMHLVERQYSSDPYQGSGWWASLNCTLAIAHRLRVMSNLVPQDEDEKAWAYLKNAMGVFTELTMRNTDLLSVQALLGMALFMQGTPNPQPSFLLVAAAIRLSHSIGLHKRGTGFNLNPIEIEQRKRVFWIAYMLDKDLCLRSGRPPAQDDDDMNVDLPDADPVDNIGNIPLADGKGKMNIFRTMVEFSVIESKVYNRLYSTTAAKQSDGEILNAIGELDRELEEWKDAIPIEFRPEHEIKASHTPLILHVVMLHLTYYNCLMTVHRMSVHHGYWTSRLADYAIQGLNSKPLNPRVFSSASLSTAAARASISLLKYVPQGDFSCVWMILYFPVSALVTLFGNVLQNPLDPRSKSDNRLMELVVTFLSMLGQEAEQGGVHRMLGVCSEFVRIARAVIERAEKEQSTRRKRRLDGKLVANGKHNTKTGEGTIYDSEVPIPTTMDDISPPVPQGRSSSWGPVAAIAQSPPERPSPGNTSSPNAQPMPPQGDFEYRMPEFLSTNDPAVPLMANPFTNPLLPQDLFSLPMTLDWNWAEMSGGAYPTVENGNFGSGNINLGMNMNMNMDQSQQQQQYPQ